MPLNWRLQILFSSKLHLSKAAFMLILRRQNQRFETLIQNADPKRPSREYRSCFPREEDDFVSMHCALFEATVRAQVNRKGVYMTSFKRGYNVILRSCFHQNQRFALTTIVNAHFRAAFMLILRRQNQRFETLIQNADPKRPSREYCSCFPREEDDSWACTAHCSRLLFELKWTGKAFIWRHLNVVICDFAFMLPPESAFCSNHDRKRTFLGVLNQRFETTFIRK